MSFDPFGDFETAGYLRNSLGLKDPEDVKRSEHLAFELSINDALDFLAEVASVDYESIRHVHNILFSEFYPWAGQDRNELVPGLAVFKGSADNPRHTTFEHPKGIKHAIDYALQLASDHEHFKKRPGEVMGLLAFAHPFWMVTDAPFCWFLWNSHIALASPSIGPEQIKMTTCGH